MKQSQSQQHNDDVILLVIAIIYTLLTLLTQLISELWHSYLSNTKSPRSLATNLSPKTKVQHNTQPMSTTKTLPKVPSHAPVTSTETRRVSSVATGFQPVARTVNTPRKKVKNSLAGTTCQPRRHRRIRLSLLPDHPDSVSSVFTPNKPWATTSR
jgi:hypothetical protein